MNENRISDRFKRVNLIVFNRVAFNLSRYILKPIELSSLERLVRILLFQNVTKPNFVNGWKLNSSTIGVSLSRPERRNLSNCKDRFSQNKGLNLEENKFVETVLTTLTTKGVCVSTKAGQIKGEHTSWYHSNKSSTKTICTKFYK